jgi:hypothetical protein
VPVAGAAAQPPGKELIAEAFATFWTTYPRRTGKGKARDAFTKAVQKAGIGPVLAGAQRFASDPNLPTDEAQFIPIPATWLNQERWDDGPLANRNSRNGSNPYLRRLASRPAAGPIGDLFALPGAMS